MSHPVWVRGLKHATVRQHCSTNCVAPRVGAWIETTMALPHAQYLQSHPVWVRGLKLLSTPFRCGGHASHPVWVRGLKLK